MGAGGGGGGASEQHCVRGHQRCGGDDEKKAASKVQAIADNETDARTLGRLIEAIETPNELDAMFSILDMLRGRRFSISAERRELLRALVNEATWPHRDAAIAENRSNKIPAFSFILSSRPITSAWLSGVIERNNKRNSSTGSKTNASNS